MLLRFVSGDERFGLSVMPGRAGLFLLSISGSTLASCPVAYALWSLTPSKAPILLHVKSVKTLNAFLYFSPLLCLCFNQVSVIGIEVTQYFRKKEVNTGNQVLTKIIEVLEGQATGWASRGPKSSSVWAHPGSCHFRPSQRSR